MFEPNILDLLVLLGNSYPLDVVDVNDSVVALDNVGRAQTEQV